MDNRRGPGSSDPSRYVPELGTDTVPVKLVELQSVGTRRQRGTLPFFLVGIAVVAVVAFALGGSLSKAPLASANPTSAAVLPSISAAAATPTATARRTVTAPTLSPTPTPAPTFPWTWTRSELSAGTSIAGVWGVDDRVLRLEKRNEDEDNRHVWQVGTLSDDGAWRSFPAPLAVANLFGGTVFDGRVWFLAEVDGITEADRTWQLVNTATGETWDSHGVSDGLAPVSAVSFLQRFEGVWVASVYGYEGAGSHLVWSSGGRSWHSAELPKFTGNVEFWEVGQIGDRLLTVAREFRSCDDVETLLLKSADGKAWERSPLPMPKGRAAFQLSCNLDACVVPIDPLDEDRTEREVLVSSNGRDWSAVMLDLPMLDEGLTMRFIQPVGSEFVAIAGNSGFALLSADGRDWIPVQVMPPDRVEWLGGLAVAGDVVVGYAPSQAADTTDAIWQGSLSEMRKG